MKKKKKLIITLKFFEKKKNFFSTLLLVLSQILDKNLYKNKPSFFGIARLITFFFFYCRMIKELTLFLHLWKVYSF
jgi:hypothetical protein